MEAVTLCPLKSFTSISLMQPMGLSRVMEIENHISTSSCHPPLKDLVCYGAIDGTTPLLLACSHGELEAVKRIVEAWEVDVRAVSAYYMQTELSRCHFVYDESFNFLRETQLESEWIKMDGASPLFVAANNGNLDVVRYLLAKGADFLTKTTCAAHIEYDGLTPLHGPFFDCRSYDETKAVPIIRLLLEAGADPSALPTDKTPIWMKSNCGFEATTTLINHGLDLKQHDPDSLKTILHQSLSQMSSTEFTEEQCLFVVKLLVDKGVDLLARDCCRFTPTLLAADQCRYGYSSVLDYLLERGEIPLMDKIDALELAGAEILSSSNAPLYNKAFDYWRRALQLRQLESEKYGYILKSPLVFESVKTVEWVNSAQLENVIQDSSQYLVQSYLTQLRIVVSRNSWEALDYHLLHDCTIEESNKGDQPNKFALILDMLWATLETIRCYFPLRIGKLSKSIGFYTNNFVEMLLVLQSDHPLLLTVETMKISLELISDTDSTNMADCSGTNTVKHMIELLQLIQLLAGLPHMLNETGRGMTGAGSSKTPETIIKESLNDLVQRDRRDKEGRTLLHIACSYYFSSATIRLLLDSGADPNIGDVNGDTPLHALAEFDGELADDAAQLLLERGAHFDRVNKSGKTAADVWVQRHEGANEWSLRPSWCREPVPSSLMCQSARAVRINKVPYTSLNLPEALHPFVKMH